MRATKRVNADDYKCRVPCRIAFFISLGTLNWDYFLRVDSVRKVSGGGKGKNSVVMSQVAQHGRFGLCVCSGGWIGFKL